MQLAAREALMGALQVLAAAATPTTLRRVLHLLVDDPDAAVGMIPVVEPATGVQQVSPDATAPPGLQPDGALLTQAGYSRPRTTAPPQHPNAGHPARRLPAKPTRPNDPAASSPKPALSARDWLGLREQVKATQLYRGLGSRAELATALGLAPATVLKAMNRRTPPSAPIAAKLRAFIVADPGKAQAATQAPGRANGGGKPATAPAPAVARAGGQTAPLPIETVKQLRKRRHATPLTTGSLAGQLGVDVAELDAAIAGQAVSAMAAERLAAWATAG